MTVEQLIAELLKHPPHLLVLVSDRTSAADVMCEHNSYSEASHVSMLRVRITALDEAEGEFVEDQIGTDIIVIGA